MPVNYQPSQYRSLTPNLVCKNASAAIDFYKKVFGATVLVNMPGPNNAVMHAELKVGDSIFFVADSMNPAGAAAAAAGQSLPCYIHVYVPDVDAVVKQAEALGAKVDMPVQDMFWGDRYGKISDPFGQQWGVATFKEEVAPEEMKRRMDEMMRKSAQG
jgi:uncharacterized glyoxalase superfamily protein PhnB